jgi:hypothetical protein
MLVGFDGMDSVLVLLMGLGQKVLTLIELIKILMIKIKVDECFKTLDGLWHIVNDVNIISFSERKQLEFTTIAFAHLVSLHKQLTGFEVLALNLASMGCLDVGFRRNCCRKLPQKKASEAEPPTLLLSLGLLEKNFGTAHLVVLENKINI